MYHNQETLETWDKLAALYEEKFMDLTLYHATYDLFCDSIHQPGARLLDIGCGPGNITHYLLMKKPDLNILGIDTSPNMIALAEKNNPGAKFAVMDGRNIRQLDTLYDGILGGFCLPYLTPTECAELISAASALLRHNGMLYLSFVEGNPEQSEFKSGIGGRVYFNYHTLAWLLNQLQQADFHEITTHKVSFPKAEQAPELHTIVMGRKKGNPSKP